MRVTVRAISVEWKKPSKCVDSKKEHCTFGTKGPGKMKGGERPHHRATWRSWNTKETRRAEAEMECQTMKT